MEHTHTERQIAAKLGIPTSTVHYWLTKRTPSKRTGRRRKTDVGTDRLIFETSEINPFMPATLIKRHLELDCSSETIRRRLKENGLKSRIAAKKPFLKPVHRTKRLQFAMYYINFPMADWKEVIFTDEKIFASTGYGSIRVWRPDGKRFDEAYVNPVNRSGRFSIAVWVCIGVINRIHLIARQTLNAEYYVNHILEPIIGGIEDTSTFSFMHDLSPIHTSKLAKRWLIDRGVNVLWDWPPKGADLNPVENVFAEIQRRLSDRNPTNREELWEMVRDTFQELPESYFTKLIESMQKRTRGVYEHEGGWVKY
ncbi:Transposable element Tc1 transposase [Araneus ventricosus]|uniref:Transposable element Tc1 transposase n=1 Tax=Araneus ventricosus TaxID=182803 RepID=A0A4Y2QQK8_ARAVE|nr:Transposable element Tc1 transposase [Araneus ventricosus]